MRKFKIEKDPYDCGNLYKKANIEIESGVTVLVGCNGSGKSTLIRMLKDDLKKKKIPVFDFNNLNEGGSKAISSASYFGDYEFMATAMMSSEGENIVMNMGKVASKLRKFIDSGESDKESERLANIFAKVVQDDEVDEKEISNERWLLFDAIDSGLSVDNVVDIKEYLFNTIIKDGESKGKDIYIVVSANEYEMCNGEKCFDVSEGKYVKFDGYEDYREFIVKSRGKKDKRSQSEVEK